MATVVLLTASAVTVCAQSQAPPQPAKFRSGATLVPVDVRVIDAKGNPVTDLTKADFIIRENGVPQDISQFLQHTMSAEPAAAGATPFRRLDADATFAPQGQRIFLILLGRGRLQPPSYGVDAALQFVRERLLPQDLVAVMAWNRATTFTTNRDEVLAVLERFKTQHENIEAHLASWFSGLQALYGTPEIPTSLQADIDTVFATKSGPAHSPGAAPVTGGKRIADETLKNSEDLLRQQAQQVEGQPKVEGAAIAPFPPSAQAASLDMSFDEYVASNKQTIQDVTNIYTGIEYLRYINGEKHLVFVTQDGFMLPSGDDDEGLAAMANDARVAIDTIQTGGLNPGTSKSSGFNQMFKVGSMRDISRLTGGTSSAFRYASDALDRIDRATRASYLLGYYPPSSALDGRYRRITVSVKRPGLTVQYRHGYFGRDPLTPIDARQSLSYTRISAAGALTDAVRDLKVALKASGYADRDGAGHGVQGRITVSPDRVQFRIVGGKHVALLHMAVFCGNASQDIVGQRWREVQVAFADDVYKAFLRDGLAVDIRIPVTSPATFVKVVVYDLNADLLGSAMVRIR